MNNVLDLTSFVALVESATRRAGYEVIKREGALLHVKRHDHTLPCNLTTAHQAYLSSPNRLDDIIDAHLTVLKNMASPPPPPTEKEAAESFLPLLQQTRWLQETKATDALPLLSHSLATGLVITYVFDMPTHRAYVNTEMAERMMGEGKLTLATLHDYALNNLRLRTNSYKYETHGKANRLMVTCETQDGFAATSILLPELMMRWADRMPGRLLIGIPNRDFLILFSDRHPTGIEGLSRQIRRDASQRSHPLSARLLVWEGEAVREYQPLH